VVRRFVRQDECQNPHFSPQDSPRLASRDELIFPIKDAASAALMLIKADSLHKAGVISEGERQWVNSRARTFLDDATLKDAA
jgi:hypothetical protein